MRPEPTSHGQSCDGLVYVSSPVVKYFAPFLHRKCPKQGKAGRQFQRDVYLQWVNNKISWPSYCTLDSNKTESKGDP